MITLINDIKFACRILAKRPGFTAIVLITLSLGIGINTILFSVVNALAFRRMNVKQRNNWWYVKPEEILICIVLLLPFLKGYVKKIRFSVM